MNQKLFRGFIAFIALLIAYTVEAQKIDVEWGPIQKEIRNTFIDQVIGNDDNGYYILRRKAAGFLSSPKYFIERFNNENVLEFSKEFSVQNKQKKECSLEKIFYTKDGFVVFMVYYDNKNDKNICYVQTYDKNVKTTSGIEEVDFIVSKKRANNGEFTIQISDNGSKFLVSHQEAFDKKKNEKFSYKVFDINLQLLWEKDIELPYKDKDVSIFDYEIDNDGYVYAMEKVESEIKGGFLSKTKKLYSFKIITYDYKKDKLDEIPLSLGGARYISDVTFALDNSKNKIIVTGFFANKEKNAGIAGTIFIRIDKSNFKVEYENAAAFDKKFLTEVRKNTESERKAKKAEDINSTFDLDHIIIKEDGGIILVAEEYFMRVVAHTSSSGGITTTTYTYYYYYRNIVAININPDGTIKWASVVPKYQLTVNDGGAYSSYITTYHNDKLYFWYNDNPKNTAAKTKPEKRGKYVMNKPKKAMVVMASIDREGEVTQDAFFKSKNDAKSILKPKMNARFSSNNILIYSEYGSKYKFGFLKITE